MDAEQLFYMKLGHYMDGKVTEIDFWKEIFFLIGRVKISKFDGFRFFALFLCIVFKDFSIFVFKQHLVPPNTSSKLHVYKMVDQVYLLVTRASALLLK